MAVKILVNPASPSSKSVDLHIRHIAQEQSKWCWAASAQMVFEHCLRIVSQCEIANRLLKKQNCCRKPKPCNVTCGSHQVDQIYSLFGLSSTYLGGPLLFSSIQAEINANRPIEMGITWDQGGGHLAIITGWEEDTTGEWVRVNDPNPANSGQLVMLYSSLLRPYGYGTWVASWTDLS